VKGGKGKGFVGVVSSVNDNRIDIHILDEFDRFSEIEEDEEPLYLL
jgi:D-lyxose ketol-isomerase